MMKKAQSSMTEIFIGVMIVVVVAVSVTIPTIQSMITSSSNPTTVNLDAITFTANNTNYLLPHYPLHTFTALYYFDNTTFPIPAARYSVTTASSLIKIYANGTLLYPNVTVGGTYYATYLYKQPGYLGDQTAVLSLLNLLPLFIVLAIVIMVVGLIKFK